jgi:hypothetical protein
VVLLSSAPRPRSRSGQANPTVTHPMPVAGPIPRQQFPSPLSNKSADHDTAMGCGRRRRPPACKTLTLEYKYLPPTKQVSSPSTLHYVLSGMSLSGCLVLDLSAQPTLDSDFPTPAAACEERSQPRPNASYESGHGNHSCTYTRSNPSFTPRRTGETSSFDGLDVAPVARLPSPSKVSSTASCVRTLSEGTSAARDLQG